MFFLTPKYLKKGRLYIKEAEKRLAYHRDRWSDVTIADFERATQKLRDGVKARDEKAVEDAENELETLCGQYCPRTSDSWIGENVEVFLVAIIVALGIRTYFLQPFTIPTASMQPTLFGITGQATEQAPPNIIKRVLDFAWYGRTWHYEVAEADGERIIRMDERKRGGLRNIFTYTCVVTEDPTGQRREYWVNENLRTVAETFRLGFGRTFRKGEPIAQGFTDTGDHVFVDKISYHFRKPKRGEVFVFDTRSLGTIERRNNPNSNTQYYIKRLAGVPGDELRIAPPQLFINGELPTEFGYQRVMAGTFNQPKDGYRGYSNRSQSPDGPPFPRLGSPTDTFALRDEYARHYWAQGDNSYQSSDSRDWGPVPPTNLMGTGVFVYWPFSRHSEGGRWGIIK